MRGLQKLCKLYGKINIQGVTWLWDYAQDKARLKTEMTKEQWAASEKAKWEAIKTVQQ